MSVVGSISIRDNATAVLRGIKKEQSSFRDDVKQTRKELKATWDKKYQAKLDATPASKALQQLKSKVAPLRKKVVTAVTVKDMATDKVKAVHGRLKSFGKKVFTPIIKVKDATAKGLRAVNGAIKSLGKNVVLPVSIAAVTATTAIVGGAVSEGAKLEQSTGGVETLFKDDAGIVKKNAEAAFKTVGVSANEYMENVTSFSASLLNSLGGDTATAAKVADMAMIDMADNANKFGTDMDSIQNAYQGFAKQNYTMLDNLKLGYGGTKQEMQRLLKDAQKITGVKYDIDNLSDVYNAIHAVQEKLGVAGTTSKEASETFSGSFSAVKAAAKNVLGSMAIGGDVTGAMSDLVGTASTFLFKNAVPMIGRVLKSLPKAVKSGIKGAAPQIRASGGEIVNSLKAGIVELLPSSMTGVFAQVFDGAGNLGSGFASIAPQLTSFGTSMVATFSQVATACIPLISSVITTVQTMLPVILPVIETVVGTIGNVLASAAPVIAGLVTGIGTVVSALAPVFSTIFSEIGEKVGSVLDFVAEHMGFIQEAIGTAAPIIGDIISTAWGVISPVIDIVISVFEILFSVVQKVFPGIQSIIETVWGIIKPIVDGIGSVMSNIAGWFGNVADAITGSSASSTSVGKNAEGDNNWKGGLTWVGEQGAELVDLPKGSRILPHKESVSMVNNAAGVGSGAVKGAVTNIIQAVVPGTRDEQKVSERSTDDGLMEILRRILEAILGGKPEPGGDGDKKTPLGAGAAQIIIQKLADKIEVRDEKDIDMIADQVAKKIYEVVLNMG